MATSAATKRLRTEYRSLESNPLENIRAFPKESNILEWHYCIFGSKNSPYSEGFYHGIVRFPPEYPFKPPSIQMLTPNGRFKTQTRLCLSMSDYHPESWNPMWSVSTILMGLYSFMMEDTPTQGSITTSTEMKLKLAKESLAYNCQDKTFCELFPDFVLLHQENLLKAQSEAPSAVGVTAAASTTPNEKGIMEVSLASWTQLAGVVGLLSLILYIIFQMAVL